jgi:hypothetical protein
VPRRETQGDREPGPPERQYAKGLEHADGIVRALGGKTYDAATKYFDDQMGPGTRDSGHVRLGRERPESSGPLLREEESA